MEILGPNSTPAMRDYEILEIILFNNMLNYVKIHVSNQLWKSEDLTQHGYERFVYICT